MLSYARLVLSLTLAIASVAVAGYGFLLAENCYVVATPSQCGKITDYVIEWVGAAGFYVGSYVTLWGLKQRWRALLDKRMVVVLSIVGVAVGGVLGDGAYYLTVVAGLVRADYPTCGGYSTPLGCFTLNPFVQIWFIFIGCFAGFGSLVVLAVRHESIKGGPEEVKRSIDAARSGSSPPGNGNSHG